MSDALHPKDVRWRQRFQNYRQALARLTEAVDLSRQRTLTDLEKQGLVQAFEFTHEMAWNVLKDFLEAQGFTQIVGSRGATRQAFKEGLIADGETWMDMIQARNLSSHTYNLDVAEGIVRNVLGRFHPAFETMEKRFATLEKETD
jgi:nucleotidyltransferase substrate binding protein (TIGR01987 family)